MVKEIEFEIKRLIADEKSRIKCPMGTQILEAKTDVLQSSEEGLVGKRLVVKVAIPVEEKQETKEKK